MKYVVYEIMTINNGIKYYGRSQEFEKRKRAHLNMLRSNTHSNELLQKNFNQFGEINFQFTIIHQFDNLEESIECELSYINNSNIEKYNISNSAVGGGDNFTNNPNKHKIRKMKQEQMGGKNNHQYGKPKTKKMIDSIKEANSKKIGVDGKMYNSISDFSSESGIKITTACYRLNSPNFKNYYYIA